MVEGGLIVPLPPRPPPQPTPPGFKTDLHCAYHQRAGYDTDSCAALRHAIQDLIDQGLVDLGRPGVTRDPLPTHDTRAVPPPPGGIHSIEFLGYEIFMMGWDGEAVRPEKFQFMEKWQNRNFGYKIVNSVKSPEFIL